MPYETSDNSWIHCIVSLTPLEEAIWICPVRLSNQTAKIRANENKTHEFS